ncbi:ATP dependent DNA ligase [Shewanella sediminis HAW-EB3]|uniref:ATP dependent DNA ligase n=1 Tax=Shewanella sediminis (strain HAW-EB3) TaxID=425104 RepID=A8FWM3_SHESH|nr:DNA ligase [Shewanella sediminis]ABV37246.1 ATP dependent DNA ligase [Shewanella sediminis HAW-EB3]
MYYSQACRLSIFLILIIFSIGLSEAHVNDIQLAVEKRAEAPISEYLVSEKLDGVRGYWDGTQLFTRSGRLISAPQWFTRGFPDYALDGELWMGRGTFEQISSLIRSKHPKQERWREVKFMVFDLPSHSQVFTERYAIAKNELANNSIYLSVIEQKRFDSVQALDTWFSRVIEQGGEGLMLHHNQSLYLSGRNRDVIKLKPLYDAEARVVAHQEGQGKFNGMLGALVVETPSGIRFKLGTGFTVSERRHPPKIGSIVTYQYSGLTQKGTPRFASFLRVRFME